MNKSFRDQVSRRQLLRGSALGIAGVAGAVLIGCGDDNDGSSSPTTSPAAGTTTPAATGTGTRPAPGTPRASGPLRLRQNQDPVHLDPHKTILYQTATYAAFVYSRLVRPATGEDIARAQFVAEGDLAESWERPDPTTYTFKLRPSARFHNVDPVNGRPVTAEDVAYTIERTLDPVTASDATYIYDRIAGVEVVDDHTVTLTTAEPFAPQFSYLMGNHSWIIPREAVEMYGDLTRNAIGSGPYILKSWEEGVGAEFERNAEWASANIEGAPFFSNVEFPLVPDESAALARFISGQFDVMSLRAEDAADVIDSGATVRQSPGTGDTHLTFGRLSNAPFDDPRVRQALGRIVNREQIVDLVYGGAAKPKGPIAPAFTDWALPQDEVAALFGYNPSEGQKLIDSTGLKWEDISITIDVTPRYGTAYPQMAEIVAAGWQQMGVNAKISQNEYAAQIQKWQTADSDAILNPQTQFLEADEFLSFYHTDGNRNWTKFSNTEIDELIERQRSMTDIEERNALVLDIQRKLADHMSTIPLVTADAFLGLQPYVRDYYENLTYGEEGSWHGWFERA